MSKVDAIKAEYGDFISHSPTVEFSADDVPKNLHSLIPYASFWGITDDLERENLVENAPDHLKVSLQKLIADNDDALDGWLAGDESSHSNPSGAYIAFSAMRMAADFM